MAVEDFSKKMSDILNYGALNLALAIGYRVGLFDVLDNFDAPQPAAVIADKAGLDERYVFEWLGVMASGGIVDIEEDESETPFFFLPSSHGDLIARRAGKSNMGVYTQEIPLLTACVMDDVADAMKTGNGIGYDRYPRFQAFMTELADAKHQQVLVKTFLPSVGQGSVVKQMKNGIRVCDTGCGEGLATLLMAKEFPNSRFVGIDISESALEKARSRARDMALSNTEFYQVDAASPGFRSDFRSSFDYVTAFDATHDQTHPQEALASIHDILKPAGHLSLVDIAASSRMTNNMKHPMGPFLYTVSLMHCMPVGLCNDGAGLGMMWGREKAVQMIRQAGFKSVQVMDIPDDPFNLHFFCMK